MSDPPINIGNPPRYRPRIPSFSKTRRATVNELDCDSEGMACMRVLIVSRGCPTTTLVRPCDAPAKKVMRDSMMLKSAKVMSTFLQLGRIFDKADVGSQSIDFGRILTIPMAKWRHQHEA